MFVHYTFSYIHYITLHLADAFIQSDLQMRTIEAIKANKRATTCKRYDTQYTKQVFFFIKENK